MFLTYTFFVEFASPFIELHLSFFKSYHSVFLDSLNLVVRKRSFHSQCEFLLNKMWLTPKKFLRVGEFRSESFSDLLALISWILINQLITYPDYLNYQLVKIFSRIWREKFFSGNVSDRRKFKKCLRGGFGLFSGQDKNSWCEFRLIF